MTWVSVEDGLPEVGVSYWVATPTNIEAMPGWFTEHYGWSVTGLLQTYRNELVTHFMPKSYKDNSPPDLPEE